MWKFYNFARAVKNWYCSVASFCIQILMLFFVLSFWHLFYVNLYCKIVHFVMFPTVYIFCKKKTKYIIFVCRGWTKRKINLWHKNPCCFNFSKAARETVGTVYAFQEHMKEETEIVFKLKLYLRKNLKVKLEERAMEHRKWNVMYSNVAKSVT